MSTTKPAPGWIKVVGIIGLLWNLLGVMAYFWNTLLMEKMLTPEVLQALPEAERASTEQMLEVIAATPAWATSAFAIAVFGGLLGCILLLMRKSLAVPVFALSLAGVVVQNIHSYMVANALEVFGIGAVIQSTLVVIIAVFLLWVAQKAKQQGWSS